MWPRKADATGLSAKIRDNQPPAVEIKDFTSGRQRSFKECEKLDPVLVEIFF